MYRSAQHNSALFVSDFACHGGFLLAAAHAARTHGSRTRQDSEQWPE